MKCVICKNGDTAPGQTTVTLTRGNCTVIFKDVPADICNNCGEYYLTDGIYDDLYKRAEQAMSRGVEVEILRYAA